MRTGYILDQKTATSLPVDDFVKTKTEINFKIADTHIRQVGNTAKAPVPVVVLLDEVSDAVAWVC